MKYAKIENDFVTNVIICDDSQINTFLGTYVKVTNETGEAIIGGTYDFINKKFIDPKPYPSWILNSDYKWESPVGQNPNPASHIWDEDSSSWITREIITEE